MRSNEHKKKLNAMNTAISAPKQYHLIFYLISKTIVRYIIQG